MSWIKEYWSKIDSEKKARWVLAGNCACLHLPERHDSQGRCLVQSCSVECSSEPSDELREEAERFVADLEAPLPAGWMAL